MRGKWPKFLFPGVICVQRRNASDVANSYHSNGTRPLALSGGSSDSFSCNPSASAPSDAVSNWKASEMRRTAARSLPSQLVEYPGSCCFWRRFSELVQLYLIVGSNGQREVALPFIRQNHSGVGVA
ncbi:Hypothetical protein NTJ_14486 [Nesidiocoris tenuis]|uniref:Uncharacterized protein n=1 Tax=Nesidiocoris tenuis TaxID=355587 RepID=A0ABN7BBA8_9HEMI|nr:Hypothetical protein NTJ_14486 [Nesidiocoris tenuis]